MACRMLQWPAATAASIRCFQETSVWPRCRPAVRSGFSRSRTERGLPVKRSGIIWTAAHVVAVTVVSAVVMTAAIAQQQSGVDQAKIDLGKETFAHKCSHCHGPNMVNSGTITPDLRRFPDDAPRYVTTVKQGKNGRMPPWGDILNDEDLSALCAYVSSRGTRGGARGPGGARAARRA